MLLWAERFLLGGVFVASFVTIVLLNAMSLDLTQRVTLGLAIISTSLFIGHTLEKGRVNSKSGGLRPAQAPPIIKVIEQTPTEDITWDFDHVLGLVGGGGQETRVVSFQARGRNNLDEPILHVSGSIRSDVTNAQFPIRFVINGRRVPPESTNGIPRNAEFEISSAPFPSNNPPNEGVTLSRFLIDFATFTFVFEYDGKRFVRHFTNDEIWRQAEAFQRSLAGTPQPRVTPKTKDQHYVAGSTRSRSMPPFLPWTP